MACYTEILVNLDDDQWNRQARQKLGLPLQGGLAEEQAGRVRIEAGVLKTTALARRLNPTAVIRRIGDKLTVSVSV